MKTRYLIIVGLLFSFAKSQAQVPPWKEHNTPISAHPDLEVRWEATNRLPQQVWTYQLLPNRFSPEILSNVVELCSFTPKDCLESNTNGMVFQSADGIRKLTISFADGALRYQIKGQGEYDWTTNWVVGVPDTNQLTAITYDLLGKLKLNLSDVGGYFDGHRFEFNEMKPMYQTEAGGVWVTNNIKRRTVYFRRLVDGMPIARQAGHGFDIGEHGQMTRLVLTWPNLQKIKSYPALNQKAVIECLRNGTAAHGPFPMDAPQSDWHGIQRATVYAAEPSFLIVGNKLYPYLLLGIIADFGNGTAKIGVGCPIFDESKL